ncbi:MAG: S-methyl-5'-thioadenosine phosphorylase [Thermoprotei archaeon]|nr:MAG: S-methyl-5'-thioadenosine phosphorylase [Thermoprotei archaeon]
MVVTVPEVKERPEVGIIGGSGLYDPGIFEEVTEVKVYTPWGLPSDNIIIGTVRGKRVAFLPRHGRGHRVPPHRVNYRANIWALHQLGVKRIVAVSAVGSLREDYKPGDFVLPDQFIDMTKRRDYTFYEGPVVAHVQIGLEPFCPELRKIVLETARALGITIHERGTYICIEGPRFSTLAESRIWKEVFKCDIIGMTLVPEINLARELGMCYVSICMVTDYDIWAERIVTAEEVVRVMKENVEKAKKLLYEVIPKIPRERHCKCEEVLRYAFL